MSNLKQVGVFLAGFVLGVGAVLIAPREAPRGPSPGQMPVIPEEMRGDPGAAGQPVPGLAPGSPGAPGAVPGATAGAMPGAPGEAPSPVQPAEALPEEFTSAGVAERPAEGGGKPPDLDTYLIEAPERWDQLKGRAQAEETTKGLTAEIEAVIDAIPERTDRMPPMVAMVSFLVKERLMLDKMAAAGMDVAAESSELDRLLNPPRKQIDGGADRAKHPGGAGKAPPGTRPQDPDAPRRVE